MLALGGGSLGIIHLMRPSGVRFLAIALLFGCGGAESPARVETGKPCAEEEARSVWEIVAETPVDAAVVAEDAPDRLCLLHERETGDLDAMVEHRHIRPLVTCNKTLFF